MKFIIIAAVFLFAVIVGVSSIAVKKTYFDKAPNDIKVPEGDSSHKIEIDEENEEQDDESEITEEKVTPEQEDTSEDESDEPAETPNEESEITTNITPGSRPTNYSSIKDGVDKSDNFKTNYTQGIGVNIDKSNNFIFHSMSRIVYTISIVEDNIVIEENKKEINEINGEETTEKIEKFKESQSDLPLISPSTIVPTGLFIVKGGVSEKYLILLVTKDYKSGKIYIMDNQFNIHYKGLYDEQSRPAIGENKVFYGKHNCKGKRSNNSTGPVIEIYELNTKTGEEQYKYNIDSQNKLNICQ